MASAKKKYKRNTTAHDGHDTTDAIYGVPTEKSTGLYQGHPVQGGELQATIEKGGYMTIKFDLTAKDLEEFQKYNDKSKDKTRPWAYWVIAFFLSFGISSALFEDPIFTMVLMIVIFSIFVFWIPFAIKRFNRKQFEEIVRFCSDKTFSLKEDAYEHSGKTDSTTSEYITITKLVRYKDYIYIFINSAVDGAAHIIPVSAFADDEETERFLGILREKTGKEIEV